MLTKRDLDQIRKAIQDELSALRKDNKTIKEDISQIRKDIKTIVNFFDKEYLELRERVDRLEQHLNLPPLS